MQGRDTGTPKKRKDDMRTLRDMSRGSSGAASIASAGMLKLASLATPIFVCGLLGTSALASDDRLSLAECEHGKAG